MPCHPHGDRMDGFGWRTRGKGRSDGQAETRLVGLSVALRNAWLGNRPVYGLMSGKPWLAGAAAFPCVSHSGVVAAVYSNTVAGAASE